MNNSLGQTERWLLRIVAAFLIVFVALTGWFYWGLDLTIEGKDATKLTTKQKINYVMGKVHSVVQLFTLEGREINRKFISANDVDPNQINGATPLNNVQSTVQNNSQKAIADVNSQGSLYKKGNSAVDNKDKSKKTAKENAEKKQTQAANEKVKAQAEAQKLALVNKEKLRLERQKQWDEYNYRSKKLSETKSKSDELLRQQQQQNQAATAARQTALTVSRPINTNKEEDKSKKSIEEWRSEIISAKSPEAARAVIVGLVAAFKGKQVEQIDFYATVQTLLKTEDESYKGLGLYALRGSPSYTSYLLLVKQQAEFSPALQKYIEETLISYHQGGIGTFQQALSSKDNQVITKTLAVLKFGLSQIKGGTAESLVDSRYRRDSEHDKFSFKDYIVLKSVLNDVIANGDQTVKASASEIAQLISTDVKSTPAVVAGN